LDEDEDKPDRRRTRAPLRATVAIVCTAFFLWCAWGCLRAGASRMVSDYAARTASGAAADAAIALSPADPEARYARANILADAGEYPAASSAYEEALRLRPRDYVIRVELGKAREEAGDVEGALDALREAVSLAPAYARPRWQLGNALLRAGRRDEARAELRRAAESDPRLYPNLVQTLWYAGGRDPRALVQDAQPRTKEQTLAVVTFLIKAGEARDGVRVLRESGAELTTDARRALVADLITAYDFADAYEVWSEGREAPSGSFTDGGFEADARTDEEGFGWRFARDAQGVKLSLDSDSPREGARSLKIEYAGNSNPDANIVSQLIPVEPGARYRLTFAARTKELVTGGPPFVEVVSAAKGGASLASLPTLANGMMSWQDLSADFNVPQGAGAVLVALKRRPCTSSPCPAFGSVWLDAFELRRL
jgi:tetratricopeptide (TPR) repeat protein